jgi:type I restriction enzyme, S subunit
MIINEELPNTWGQFKISDISIVNPTLVKSEIPEDLDVSFVPMTAVQAESGFIDVSNKRKFSDVKKGYTPFREGDVLFAKITPCMENGKMAVVPALRNDLGFGSTEFHVLRALSGVNARYIYYYVSSQSFRREAEHNMSGAVGQRRVTTHYLAGCEIPIPPTNEQQRIVIKIEAFFSELDKGIESFKTAREQLKIYRQALLKHAFSGKLTEQRRAENADKLESAEALLQRIQSEREQRYQQQLKDWEAAGKQGSKPKAPKTLPPLTAEELSELPGLPMGWVWVKLGIVCDRILDGTHFSPKSFSEGQYKYITAKNIKEGYLDLSNITYLDEMSHREIYSRCDVKFNDVLYIKDGATTGIATVNKLEEEFSLLSSVAVFRFPSNSVMPKFAEYFLNSKITRNRILKEISGVAITRLTLEKLNRAEFALPPIEEQKQIVIELESKLSFCDQLDQTLTTALQQAEALRQSILKKAFSGQLVPQDPNDEPASVLLERIQVEKAALLAQAKTLTPKTKSAKKISA